MPYTSCFIISLLFDNGESREIIYQYHAAQLITQLWGVPAHYFSNSLQHLAGHHVEKIR